MNDHAGSEKVEFKGGSMRRLDENHREEKKQKSKIEDEDDDEKLTALKPKRDYSQYRNNKNNFRTYDVAGSRFQLDASLVVSDQG